MFADAYPRTVWPFQQPPPWHPWCTCAFCLLFLAPLEPLSPRSDRVILSIHQSVHLFICFFKSQFYIKFSLIFFCFVGWTSFFFFFNFYISLASPVDVFHALLILCYSWLLKGWQSNLYDVFNIFKRNALLATVQWYKGTMLVCLFTKIANHVTSTQCI